MAEGIIMKALSGFYYVDDGEKLVTCRGRGKLRHEKVTPLVGDRVRFTPTENGAGALDEILPRRNEFYRPAVANIDQLVVIASGAIVRHAILGENSCIGKNAVVGGAFKAGEKKNISVTSKGAVIEENGVLAPGDMK